VEPELVERYVEDGTLRIEWRDFPFLGQESVNAALAARAAQEQGKFWEYHDILYENQRSLNTGAFSDDNLIDLAREAGLDVERFEGSFTSGKYEAVVNRVFREAQDAGIQGTPSFSINGRILVGPQPLETFEQVIEEEAQGA
jgi:protein-disulfide isomerase